MRDVLDSLCPMHVVVNPTGHIVHAGPTLAKVVPEGLVSRRFLEVFELRRPRRLTTLQDVRKETGRKLHLRLRGAHATNLKGVLVDEPGTDNTIVNLSFGISVVDAVSAFNLTSGDFAATDLAIEMLYLVEAKSAAMEASRKLNQRLQGAKLAAEADASTDTLTGLKNRRALDHVLSRYALAETEFAVMLLDLDYFKSVNDTLGHAAGDAVLLEVASILNEETRDSDTVARAGGDEFTIMFQSNLPIARLNEIAKRLIARLEEPIVFGEDVCRISGSIGIVSSANYDPIDLARMLDDADVALYASKKAGRGRHTHYCESLRKEEPIAKTG